METITKAIWLRARNKVSGFIRQNLTFTRANGVMIKNLAMEQCR